MRLRTRDTSKYSRIYGKTIMIISEFTAIIILMMLIIVMVMIITTIIEKT